MAPLARSERVHAVERPGERHLHRLRPYGRHAPLSWVRQEHRHLHLPNDQLRNGLERGRPLRPLPQVLRLRRPGGPGQVEDPRDRLHRRRRSVRPDLRGRGTARPGARPDGPFDGLLRERGAEGHLRRHDRACRAPHPDRLPQFLMVRPEAGKGQAQAGRPRRRRDGLRGQGDCGPCRALAPRQAFHERPRGRRSAETGGEAPLPRGPRPGPEAKPHVLGRHRPSRHHHERL